ncbi:MAG: Hsp20/alpha crystallin family protein [Bacteroidetes bacterium]|nr:Hsp20/alpha crystallin family protein [Bacteroidota bacterium]
MMRNDFDWMKEVQDFSSRLKNYFENFDRSPGAGQSRGFMPVAEAYHVNGTYYIEVELPGMKKEEIRITMSGNSVEVSGEKRLLRPDGASSVTGNRTYGQFTRRITLPADAVVDATNSVATYENGVLTITLPQSTKSSGTSIPIN